MKPGDVEMIDMAQAEFFKRDLTAVEVAAIYNAGWAGKCRGAIDLACVEGLGEIIGTSGLPDRMATSLLAKVDAALKALATAQINAAANVLNALQNELAGQLNNGKKADDRIAGILAALTACLSGGQPAPGTTSP